MMACMRPQSTTVVHFSGNSATHLKANVFGFLESVQVAKKAQSTLCLPTPIPALGAASARRSRAALYVAPFMNWEAYRIGVLVFAACAALYLVIHSWVKYKVRGEPYFESNKLTAAGWWLFGIAVGSLALGHSFA